MTISTTTTAPDIDSLVRDYYIDSSNFIHQENEDDKKQQWSNEYKEEDIVPYRYCDICRLDRADWLRYYCYSNKGLNRELITICIKCLDKYNHIDHKQWLQRLLEQQRFVAENNNACLNNNNNNNNRNGKLHVTIGGVIDIKTANKARDHIILALKLISTWLNKYDSSKSNSDMISSKRYYYAPISAAGIPDDKLFYDTVMIAYDQSQMVRDYFGNDASSIRPENKKVWPLRYQAYKEFGI
jgi:hypothetical protein